MTMEKSSGPKRGGESQHEGETIGGGAQDRCKDRLLESGKSTGVNLEPTLPSQKSRDKGKETKLAGKELQEVETFHDIGKAFCVDKQQESILPILGKEGQKVTTHRKESGEEMQWEMVIAQREDPTFVFNERPESIGGQYEANIVKPNKALGLMAMTYSNELGWIAEALGPTSGH